MMIKRLLTLALLLYTVLIADTKPGEDQVIASVGGTKIFQEDYKAFQTMLKYYPVKLNNRHFPGKRDYKTLCIESQAISRGAGKGFVKDLKKQLDFQWKMKYFPAQVYLRAVLVSNLGNTEKEITEYYNKNKAEFKKTKKLEDGRDSTWTASRDASKRVICERLFLNKYPPDDKFYRRFLKKTGKDSGSIDSASAQRNWVRKNRARLPEFFMEKYYKEYTGEALPDSTDQIIAEGGLVDSADLEIIKSWLPSPRGKNREEISDRKKRFLTGWLIKWEVFSRKAKESGFLRQEKYGKITDWAKKYEVALSYVNQVVVPKVKQYKPEIDTQMCVYDYWDDARNITPYNKQKLQPVLKRAQHRLQSIEFERRIAEIRESVGVEFYYKEFQDDNYGDPEKLLAEADSLAETDDSEKAKRLYRRLKTFFGYTESGKDAYKGLAKFYKGTDLFVTAIGVYRNYLIVDKEAEDRDNVFFMIGFIYDEHMKASNLAFAQYRWIMKNAPESELIDDIEFMAHHIDEPMPSVKELQAEAKRQGKDKG